MRLRQAHAILEAATALEAAGLGFELWPFDRDAPGAVGDLPDCMTGYAEFTPAETPDRNARTYNIELLPGPGVREVTARVVFGYPVDPEARVLLAESFCVAPLSEEPPAFRPLVGADIAGQVAAKVREHEATFPSSRPTYIEED